MPQGKRFDRGVKIQPKERWEATSPTCNPNRIERDWVRVEERDIKSVTAWSQSTEKQKLSELHVKSVSDR